MLRRDDDRVVPGQIEYVSMLARIAAAYVSRISFGSCVQLVHYLMGVTPRPAR